jgi:hypothetical protein
MTNKELFDQNGYVIIRNAISDELRDFVTQYALFDEMQNFLPETSDNQGFAQVPGAHSRYADPAMEVILLHLHKTMEENTGLKLYPTYSYYRVYRIGDDLKIHTDRPSCEISCTLNFNVSDENIDWPIYMEGNPVSLKPGDMVIYRGCDLNHWREKFECKDTDWQVQGFFHYVNANGPYSDWKFDKRSTVGEPDSRYKKVLLPKKPYIHYVD